MLPEIHFFLAFCNFSEYQLPRAAPHLWARGHFSDHQSLLPTAKTRQVRERTPPRSSSSLVTKWVLEEWIALILTPRKDDSEIYNLPCHPGYPGRLSSSAHRAHLLLHPPWTSYSLWPHGPVPQPVFPKIFPSVGEKVIVRGQVKSLSSHCQRSPSWVNQTKNLFISPCKWQYTLQVCLQRTEIKPINIYLCKYVS